MITIRASQLNQYEVEELLTVLMQAKRDMCKDVYPTSCDNCMFRRLCLNLKYNISYLERTLDKMEKS